MTLDEAVNNIQWYNKIYTRGSFEITESVITILNHLIEQKDDDLIKDVETIKKYLLQ